MYLVSFLLLFQYPQFQERPFLTGIVVLFQLGHAPVTGRSAGHKVKLRQKNSLGGIGLFETKGVQKVDQHHCVVGIIVARGKGVHQFLYGFNREIAQRRGREENIGLAHSLLGGLELLTLDVVEIANHALVVETDGFSVGHGLGGNVNGGYIDVAASESPPGLVDGLAGFLVLPVLANIVVGHAVEAGHGGVSKAGAEIDVFHGFIAVIFAVEDGGNVLVEHGLVELVRDVVHGIENADLVGNGSVADIDVVEVLLLFVGLDSGVVDVFRSHLWIFYILCSIYIVLSYDNNNIIVI
mmetsp:Transcript_666/g.1509  ORF Transcript_666/g.1509 Transcript_666/m.1509 type:complete len:296 (-) Transcript_666:92-979(-)